MEDCVMAYDALNFRFDGGAPKVRQLWVDASGFGVWGRRVFNDLVLQLHINAYFAMRSGSGDLMLTSPT